jgi:cell division protease FtsH
MPDPQTPTPDKKKNRSFGAFLLFLTVLMVVLFWFGDKSLAGPTKLTQDQYEYLLLKGEVDQQTFRGSNLIRGSFKVKQTIGGKREVEAFEVSYAGLESKEREFRELKAIPKPDKVRREHLLEAIRDGWYIPSVARVLTSTREGPAQAGAEAGAVQVEELLVEVRAKSQGDWTGVGNQSFYLPATSGTVSLAVEDVGDVNDLLTKLEAAGATTESRFFDLRPKMGSSWSEINNLLTGIFLVYGPWILIFVVFLIFMRQMRSQGGAGGVMSFGRSRAQLYSKESHTNITFDDVAGAQEAKDEVSEVVEFLRNPSRFTRIGGRIPRGVLLVGPPGCGKTLLAKAIAGEAEVPFFSISGSDFVEMFVGVGASRVRDLFKQARESSPCIIFLDEIDAVGRRRGSGMGGGHDEREQTLNAILVEMDGFGTDEGIIVIAATNRPDVLDPALLRPGRFDREVVIDLPDMGGREEILRVHLKKVKVGADVEPGVLARSTPGYSGADLEAIINEAAIRAALAKHDSINMEDLEEARDKVRYGRQKKSRKLELEDKRITAYHEAGHAVVASALEEVESPHKVTIVPRGRALGATMVLPDKESYHMQKRRMQGQLVLLFGGRVAEQEFCGDISAGASDDIKRATDIARAMVTELGMSKKIGPVNYSERQGSDFLGTELMRGRTHSEETAREIDQEVRKLLDQGFERAESIIRENHAALERVAQALLAYETVNGTEVQRLMAGEGVANLRPPKAESGADEMPESKRSPAGKSEGADERGERTGELPGEPGLSPA